MCPPGAALTRTSLGEESKTWKRSAALALGTSRGRPKRDSSERQSFADSARNGIDARRQLAPLMKAGACVISRGPATKAPAGREAARSSCLSVHCAARLHKQERERGSVSECMSRPSGRDGRRRRVERASLPPRAAAATTHPFSIRAQRLMSNKRPKLAAAGHHQCAGWSGCVSVRHCHSSGAHTSTN